MCVCVNTRVCVCMCAWMNALLRACVVYVRTSVRLCVGPCILVCLCIYVCVRVCTCEYVYIRACVGTCNACLACVFHSGDLTSREIMLKK